MTTKRPVLSSVSIAIPVVAIVSIPLLRHLPGSVVLFAHILPPTAGILAGSAGFVRGERPGCLALGAVVLNFVYMLMSQVVFVIM